jgi:predicted DNA-binding transcriptional regulator AlpA
MNVTTFFKGEDMVTQILLTTQQVADRLGLSVNTLVDWRWRRIGPPVTKISSKCVRYIEEDFERWVREQIQNTPDEKY